MCLYDFWASYNSKYKSQSFTTLRDLTIRYHLSYWILKQGPGVLLSERSSRTHLHDISSEMDRYDYFPFPGKNEFKTIHTGRDIFHNSPCSNTIFIQIQSYTIRVQIPSIYIIYSVIYIIYSDSMPALHIIYSNSKIWIYGQHCSVMQHKAVPALQGSVQESVICQHLD